MTVDALQETIISPHRETTEAGFIDCPPPDDSFDCYAILARLIDGRHSVTIPELNAVRAMVGRRPFLVGCACPNDGCPGLCDCGGKLFREGEAKYLEQARLDAAHDAEWRERMERQAEYEAAQEAALRDLYPHRS
jgi:hypothetical protein